MLIHQLMNKQTDIEWMQQRKTAPLGKTGGDSKRT